MKSCIDTVYVWCSLHPWWKHGRKLLPISVCLSWKPLSSVPRGECYTWTHTRWACATARPGATPAKINTTKVSAIPIIARPILCVFCCPVPGKTLLLLWKHINETRSHCCWSQWQAHIYLSNFYRLKDRVGPCAKVGCLWGRVSDGLSDTKSQDSKELALIHRITDQL